MSGRPHPPPDLSLTCALALCFALPFLGNVRIGQGFPFERITAVEQYCGGCRLRSWFVDVRWRVTVSASPARERVRSAGPSFPVLGRPLHHDEDYRTTAKLRGVIGGADGSLRGAQPGRPGNL